MGMALVKALRAKYSSRKEALRALGVDENLLDDDADDRYRKRTRLRLGKDSSPSMLTEPEHMRSDPRGGTGGEVQGGIRRKGEDDFTVPASGSNVPRKIESNAENLSSGATDDEEDDWLSEEEQRSLWQSAQDERRRLRERGYDEDRIDEIVEMSQGQARDCLRRAKGRDFLPKNRLMGGPGGRFGGPRDSEHASGESDRAASLEYMRQIDEGGDRRKAVDHSEEDPNNEYIIDHGLDRSRRRVGRDWQAQDAIHREVRRFGPEVGCRPMRPDERRGRSDAAVPSMARQARTEQRYPGLARIEEA